MIWSNHVLHGILYMYASPSWRGFIKAEETARLKAVLSKACRYGYLPSDFHSLEDLLDSSVESLFRSIWHNPQHVLHQLLPPPKHTSYNLRSRGHGLTLSVIEFMRKNFINRMLFNDDIYWLLMFYRQDCTLFTFMVILCFCIVCLHLNRLLCVWQSFIKEFYY